jgi:hypothetical protein
MAKMALFIGDALEIDNAREELSLLIIVLKKLTINIIIHQKQLLETVRPTHQFCHLKALHQSLPRLRKNEVMRAYSLQALPYKM